MTNETPTKPGATWPLALGALAVVLGRFVPLPGIDYNALDSLLGGSSAWDLSVGPIGNTISALVMTYAFVGRSTRAWAWRAGVVFYLFCALAQGLGIAFWLESLDGMRGGLGSMYIVEDAGWKFRSIVMLAYAGGGSILWFLSRSIDASKRATGALFLLLVHVFIQQANNLATLGSGVARGEFVALEVLPWLAMPLSAIAITVAVHRRPSAEWPVTLWRWKLYSHIDVIALVAVSTLPGSLASMLHLDAHWHSVFDALLALAFGASGIAWWWKQASETESRRPTKILALVSVATLGLAFAAVFGFWRDGGIERLTAPLPLEGDQSFTLIFEAESEFRSEDAETMVALLGALGANAEIRSADARSITLEVNQAIGRDAVLRALTPVRFALSPVLDIRENAHTELFPRAQLSGYGTTRHLVGECALFAELNDADSQSSDAQGPGCRLMLEREGSISDECRLYCVSPESVLANGDVQDAYVVVPEYDPAPVVSIVLTDEAARAFGDFTANHIQENIAIEVNGRLLSVPVIQSRIDGGRLQITLPREGDHNTLLREAEQLAAGLRPGGVQTPWRLRE